MRSISYISQLITLCLIFFLASSCKTKKIVTPLQVVDRTEEEIIQALKDHNYDFSWYSCETGIQLKSPEEKVSGKAYVRMKKDSIIWAMVKKFGMEGVRILSTEKSYASIFRQDGTYTRGSTNEAFQKMGISLDFIDMQQAIFGNAILPEAPTIEPSGNHYIIRGIDQDFQLKYWINRQTLLLDRVLIIDGRSRKIQIEYSDYRQIDSGEKLAFYRHFSVFNNGEEPSEITLKMKKIEINVPKKTRFSIPSHYDRLD